MGAQRRQALHHQRRACRPLASSPRAPARRATRSRCSSSKGQGAWLHGRPLAGRPAGSRRTPPELVFEDCRIPAANLLGEQDKGFYSVMKNFQTERIALAAMAVGHCARALELTLDYVRDRRMPSAPRCSTNGWCASAGDAGCEDACRAPGLYHCAWRVTAGHDVVQDVPRCSTLTGELVNRRWCRPPYSFRWHGLHARHNHRTAGARRVSSPSAAAPMPEVMLDKQAKLLQQGTVR